MPDPRMVAEIAVVAGEEVASTAVGKAAIEAGGKLVNQALHLFGGAAEGGEAKAATSLTQPAARVLESDHSLFVHGGRDPRAWRAATKFWSPGKAADGLEGKWTADTPVTLAPPESGVEALTGKPAAVAVEKPSSTFVAQVPKVAEPSPIMKALQPLPTTKATEAAVSARDAELPRSAGQVFRGLFDRSNEILGSPGGRLGFVQMTDKDGHLMVEMLDGPLAGAKGLWKKGEDTMLVETADGSLHELGRTAQNRLWQVDSNLNVVDVKTIH